MIFIGIFALVLINLVMAVATAISVYRRQYSLTILNGSILFWMVFLTVMVVLVLKG